MTETREPGAAATGVETTAPGPAPAIAAPPLTGPPAPPGRRRGKRVLLVLAAVTSALAIAAAAVTVVLVTQRSRQAHAAAHPLRATVFRLHPGQCFDSLPNGIGGAPPGPLPRPPHAAIFCPVPP